MVKHHLRLVFLLAIVLMSACSLQPLQPIESIDDLLAHQQYQQALTRLQKDRFQDKELINKVKKESDKYRNSQLALLSKQQQKSQWFDASQTLQRLLTQVPPHPAIRKADLEFKIHYAQERRKVDTRVAIATAHVLLAKEKELRFHYGSDPENQSLAREKLVDSKKVLAEELLSLSMLAIESQDYVNAESTYELALLLDSNQTQPEHGQAISAGLTNRTKETIRERQSHLLKEMDKAIIEKDFVRIKELEKILSHSPFQGQKVKQKLIQAEKLISSTALQLDKNADTVYRQGKIDEAIDLWRQSQSLFPQLSGVKEKLERAQKVKKKLEKLRQS